MALINSAHRGNVQPARQTDLAPASTWITSASVAGSTQSPTAGWSMAVSDGGRPRS